MKKHFLLFGIIFYLIQFKNKYHIKNKNIRNHAKQNEKYDLVGPDFENILFHRVLNPFNMFENLLKKNWVNLVSE